MTEQRCFHCGLPVTTGERFTVEIDGESRAMCCPGCQAVATAIMAGGFEKFYQYRSQNSNRPDSADNPGFLAYDLPEVAAGFTTELDNGLVQVTFVVGGITCAACSWLIEKYLKQLPFIKDVKVNISAHRATVSWYKEQAGSEVETGIAAGGKLSDILKAFTEIGYEALPLGDEAAAQIRRKENRQAILRLGVAGLGMMQAGMLAISLYAGALQGMDAGMETFLRWVSVFFATPVVFYSGWPFLRAAWISLQRGRLIMDVPVSIAILLAWSASLWATASRGGEVYFDSVSMFVFFLLIGRFLEMRVRHRNELLGEGISKLLPAVALRLDDNGEQHVPVSKLQVGDQIRVSGGDVFPCDGVIAEGISEVNEALLTGEQEPVLKRQGDNVCAGAINGNSPLLVEVSATGSATRLSTIVNLVERAQSDKPTQQALADKLAGYFIAAVLIVAVLVGSVWWFIDSSRFLWVVLSVLVVTCPCALSLATPTALAVASAELRRQGFLVTRGHVLETLAKATRVVFDKTGTLTVGKMEVARVIPLGDESEAHILAIASDLEEGSSHPVARAFPSQEGITHTVKNRRHHLAAGVTGEIGGVGYALGKPAFVCQVCQFSPEGLGDLPDTTKTELLLAREGKPLGWIILQDQLRGGVKHLLQELNRQGFAIELLSGDRHPVVAKVAGSLGIAQYSAENTPEQKLAHLKQRQKDGDIIVMVGDGINDVPVLGGADVSVAMGDASDLTRIHADSILLSGNFDSLAKALQLARRTRVIIRQNLAWAILYNLVALPLAALGLVPPWAAAIGMSASSLLVVLNALRLREERVELQPEIQALPESV